MELRLSCGSYAVGMRNQRTSFGSYAGGMRNLRTSFGSYAAGKSVQPKRSAHLDDCEWSRFGRVNRHNLI